MNKTQLIVAWVMGILLLSGCVTAIDKYLKMYPDTPLHIQNCMRRREPCIGMSKKQLIDTIGRPIQYTRDKVDDKPIWVYKYYYNCFYGYCSSYDIYLAFDDNNKIVRIEKSYEKAERERKYEIEKYIQEHPSRSEFKDMMLKRKISIGMNRKEVILSWGGPTDINRTVTAYSTSEQWVYGSLGSAKYLYFDNDILTSWQD